MLRKVCVFLILFTLLSVNLNAQENNFIFQDSISTVQEATPQVVNQSPWKYHFKSALLINQTAFNNDWQGGGVSNLATGANLVYKLNYKKGTWAVDNTVRLAYGLTKIDDEDQLRKTDDNVELNTTLFKNIPNSLWSYSTFFNFKSQFSEGFNFNKDGTRTLISDVLSPAFFQFGLGFLYKKSEDFKINIAPSTLRLIVVDPFFTAQEDAFGVDQGESQNIEFGASLVANYKFTLAKNVTVENLINLYSNYVENASNVDLNYTINMNSKINKHMSADFTFQAIYDDDTVQAFQIRELISLGLNYEI